MDDTGIRALFVAGGITWRVHAVQEALADAIDQSDLEASIAADGEVIDDAPKSPLGSKCLVLCHSQIDGRPLHASVNYAVNPPRVITVYRPDDPQYAGRWSPDFRKRVGP